MEFWLIEQSYLSSALCWPLCKFSRRKRLRTWSKQSQQCLWPLLLTFGLYSKKKKKKSLCLLCFTSALLSSPSAHSSYCSRLISPFLTYIILHSLISCLYTSVLPTLTLCLSLCLSISYPIPFVSPHSSSFSSSFLSIIPPSVGLSAFSSKLIALKHSLRFTSTPFCPLQSHITQFPSVLTSFCT